MIYLHSSFTNYILLPLEYELFIMKQFFVSIQFQ